MKLLNIIITLSRTHKVLERTLDSIDKIKQDKDISVIVLSNEINIKRDLLKRFKFESKIIQSKKTYGPLYNEALDLCKAEYVTFIDADDFFDTNGIRQTLDYLKNNKPNLLRTDLAESYVGLDGKPAVGIVNYVFVETPHAHYFKLEYLKEKNIKFNDKLNIYALENFYRNAIFNTEISGLKLTTYLSGFSVVQYDKNHLPINVENIDEYYESVIDTFEMLQKNNNDYYKQYLFNVLFSIFTIIESLDFNIPILQDKKRKYEEIIYALYNDYKGIYESIDEKIRDNYFAIEFEKQRRTNINLKLVDSLLNVIFKMNNIHSEYDNSKPHFLDIIVPEYEGEEFIFDFLDSLARQKDVNFEEIGVIIVNDDSPHKIKPYKFKRYGNLNIEYIINEKNVGQGMTRQHGIDHSKAEYITMFDQDDVFYDKDDYCLSKMIAILKKTRPNVAVGNVIEQARMFNGKIKEIFYDSKNPAVFVHGLYCNRKFLNDNGYQFNPKLRQLEDTYFNRTLLSTVECISVNVNIYLWRNNKKSQVRTKNEIDFTTLHFDDFCLCTEEVFIFTKAKNEEYANKYITASLYGAYVLSNGNYSQKLSMERRIEMQIKAFSLLKKYESIFALFSDAEKKEMFEIELNALRRSMPGLNPLESLEDFMARMAKEYPDIK